MNFKELCEELIKEGEGWQNGVDNFTTLEEWPKAQAWIRQAYAQIQREQRHWSFLFASGKLFSTRSGKQDYTSAMDIAELDKDSLIVEKEEKRQSILWLDYGEWRSYFSLQQGTEGVPKWLTQKPSGEFLLAPTPDGVYNVLADWWSGLFLLEEDEDEPIWSEDFHSLIVWRALRFWAEENDVPALRSRIMQVLPRMDRAFVLRYLPATKR